MARPKSFNESKVLTDTMTLFWQKGYEATSMRDLEKASGLTAGSIYNEFGNKKKLFIRSLEFYIATVIEWRAQCLTQQQQKDPLGAVREFLVSAIKDVPMPFRGQACLLMNTATELGQQDADIGKVINKGFAKIENNLAKALSNAQDIGEVANDVDVQVAASSLSMLLAGVLTASKNQTKVTQLEAIIDFQLNLLQA